MALHANESASIFGTTAASLITGLTKSAEELGGALDSVVTSTPFPTVENTIGEGLLQVARLIRARRALEAERDVFFVSLPQFDTHSDVVDSLETLYGKVDAALAAFTAELKADGVWDSVVVQSASEFGRTLVSNGQGTDHVRSSHAPPSAVPPPSTLPLPLRYPSALLLPPLALPNPCPNSASLLRGLPTAVSLGSRPRAHQP